VVFWLVTASVLFGLGFAAGRSAPPDPVHIFVPCAVPVYTTHAQTFEHGELEHKAKIDAMRVCAKRLQEAGK